MDRRCLRGVECFNESLQKTMVFHKQINLYNSLKEDLIQICDRLKHKDEIFRDLCLMNSSGICQAENMFSNLATLD